MMYPCMFDENLPTGSRGFSAHKKTMYSKYPKLSNTLFHNFLAKTLLFMQFFLKILGGKANSVDPDQTALSEAV